MSRLSVVRFVLLSMALAIGLGSSTESADAAYPWFMIVHGEQLETSIVITDTDDLLTLMLGISESVSSGGNYADVTRQLEKRPFLDVAMFWGPDWQTFLRQGNDARTVSPRDANQEGRLYVAEESSPAVFWLGAAPGSGPDSYRSIKPTALEILSKYNIPIDVEHLTARDDQAFPVRILVLLGGLIAVTGSLIFILGQRTHLRGAAR